MFDVPQDAELSICECGSDLQGIYVPDTQKNMIAGMAIAAVVALLGVFGYQQVVNKLSPIALIRFVFTGQKPFVPNVLSEIPPAAPPDTRASIADPVRNPPQSPELQWQVEAQAKGSDAVLSRNDGFEKTAEGSYQAKQVFTKGDRFRFRFPQHRNQWVWVFYKNGNSLQQLAETHGETSQVPARDEWIRMDQNPGTEKFVLVSAAQPLDAMDNWKNGIDYKQVQPELNRLTQSPGVSVVQIDLVHQ